jgi:MoxR-like ATPase
VDGGQLAALQEHVRTVHVSAALLDYLQALLEFTRHSPLYDCGLSPRAGLALLHSAQAWALMEGRDYAMPEDIQVVLPSVVGHRLRFARSETGAEPSSPAQRLLGAVAIP